MDLPAIPDGLHRLSDIEEWLRTTYGEAGAELAAQLRREHEEGLADIRAGRYVTLDELREVFRDKRWTLG